MTTIDFSTLERLHRVYLNTAAKTKAMRTEIIETLSVGEPLHPSWKQVVTKVLYSSKTVVYSSFSSPAKFLYFSCPQIRMICTSLRTFCCKSGLFQQYQLDKLLLRWSNQMDRHTLRQ